MTTERTRQDAQRRGGGLRMVLAGGALLLAGASAYVLAPRIAAPAPGQPAPAAPAIPVVAALAATRDMPVWISGIGTVTPLSAVDVKVRVDGHLQSVAFSDGQEVNVGDPLAQIDPRPYQATLAQAEAVRRRDMAEHANVLQEVSRASRLATTGSGTIQSLDALKAREAMLAATLEQDEASIDAARLNLEFTRVTAPIAGRVGLRQADPGSVVHANDAQGLATVTQMAPIAVLFSLPQDDLAAVALGQRSGALAVGVDTRDGTSHIADGYLVFINSTVDPANGQILLKAVFDNTRRELWPGAFVSARVLVRTDRDATVVPRQAVQTGQSGFYVYVVKPDSTVALQPVVTGPVVDGMIEISRGLSPGQRVVLEGHSRLSPGKRVSVAPEPVAKPASKMP